MKITEIEVISLQVPFEKRIRKKFHHWGMTEQVTVHKFHANTGLMGLGEKSGPLPPQEDLDAYLATDPFDHIMSSRQYYLDMACYDLMGKHLAIPAWKLMGQQVRDWVAMSWWMPCMSPEDTATEIKVAVDRGYLGLKCKARAFYDVIEQSRIIQEVAPADFRVEYDFNGGADER